MASASAAEAHESVPPPGEPYTEKLAEGVHACIQPDGGRCLSNAGRISGGGSPLLTDAVATERRARTLREAGPGESGEPAESERLVANVLRAHAELNGRTPSEPLDLPSVWAHMEQLKGGGPVACHA